VKLWGGRFDGQIDEVANHFHSSISFDQRLYVQDITGSIAHAQMLGKQGVISQADADEIIKTLGLILTDINSGALPIDPNAEDIHSFVESELILRIGEAGGRLHTGRSRNDQVALDMKMYVKSEIESIRKLLHELLEALLKLAKIHTGTIMPGFTHLQKAQPITLSHHLLAYFQMFKRDGERLTDCEKRTDEMPLGSGALAATVYPIDRQSVAEKLGFSKITENSLDAVSDRDFCIEFVSCLSIMMMHLSRFCEELILWSTDGFGYIEISDAYSTGSSIMPQKKNPDMAELIRCKTGRVYGSLVGLLTVMKGLPLAYNKDMQEDKQAVFDASDTARACLNVFTGMISSTSFKNEILYKASLGGYTNATDAADWLVRQGVAFRDAHEIIGRLVRYAIEKQAMLQELTLQEFREISDVFDQSIFDVISVEASVDARNVPGGPSKHAITAAIAQAEDYLRQH